LPILVLKVARYDLPAGYGEQVALAAMKDVAKALKQILDELHQEHKKA
jgi:hypothetical protein